jgi:hypothetical protein
MGVVKEFEANKLEDRLSALRKSLKKHFGASDDDVRGQLLRIIQYVIVVWSPRRVYTSSTTCGAKLKSKLSTCSSSWKLYLQPAFISPLAWVPLRLLRLSTNRLNDPLRLMPF